MGCASLPVGTVVTRGPRVAEAVGTVRPALWARRAAAQTDPGPIQDRSRTDPGPIQCLLVPESDRETDLQRVWRVVRAAILDAPPEKANHRHLI